MVVLRTFSVTQIAEIQNAENPAKPKQTTILRRMGAWLSAGSPTVIPALCRCDGHYAIDGFDGGSLRPGWAEAAIAMTRYCGWLRFEGNGGVILRKSEADVESQIRAIWEVVNDAAVRLSLPQDREDASSRPKSLIVEEGDGENTIELPNTIMIYLPGAAQEDGCVRFSFCPEES